MSNKLISDRVQNEAVVWHAPCTARLAAYGSAEIHRSCGQLMN